MSGGDSDDLDIGTIAVNRYAAGWFGPEGVIFHRGGRSGLHPRGHGPVCRCSCSPPISRAYSRHSASGCGADTTSGFRPRGSRSIRSIRTVARTVVAGGCFGLERRTSPVPPVASFSSSEHVFGVGDVVHGAGNDGHDSREGRRELPGAGGGPSSHRAVHRRQRQLPRGQHRGHRRARASLAAAILRWSIGSAPPPMSPGRKWPRS